MSVVLQDCSGEVSATQTVSTRPVQFRCMLLAWAMLFARGPEDGRCDEGDAMYDAVLLKRPASTAQCVRISTARFQHVQARRGYMTPMQDIARCTTTMLGGVLFLCVCGTSRNVLYSGVNSTASVLLYVGNGIDSIMRS